MVVTGLSLLGGGRAEASRVADGAPDAPSVEGRFAADPAARRSVADDVGADADEDGTLIAVRTVGADGRSRAHLGRPLGAGRGAGRLAEATLAVHGQNDQLRLLRPAEQRALLDRFAGDAVAGPLERYRTRARRVAARRGRARRAARRRPRGSRRRPTCCATGSPRSGRSTRSPARTRAPGAGPPAGRRRRPAGAAATARAALAGADGADGTPTPTRRARSPWSARPASAWPAPATRRSTALDPRLGRSLALLADVGSRAHRLPRPARRRPASGWRRAGPAGRAQGAHPQVRRRHRRRARLGRAGRASGWPGLDTSDEALAALAARRDALAAELAEHAAAVTAARPRPPPGSPPTPPPSSAGWRWPTRGCWSTCARARRRTAPPTRCPSRCDARGRPRRRRRGGAAAGRARRRAAAAGAQGRLRRRAVAGDAGAGGGAGRRRPGAHDGVRRGRRRRRRPGRGGDRAAPGPARPRHQVVVVTHLPQVAAYADRHLVVDKSARNGVRPDPQRRVRTLDEADRVVELARMLAGLDDTDTGRAHAEELLASRRAPTASADRCGRLDASALQPQVRRAPRAWLTPVPGSAAHRCHSATMKLP